MDHIGTYWNILEHIGTYVSCMVSLFKMWLQHSFLEGWVVATEWGTVQYMMKPTSFFNSFNMHSLSFIHAGWCWVRFETSIACEFAPKDSDTDQGGDGHWAREFPWPLQRAPLGPGRNWSWHGFTESLSMFNEFNVSLFIFLPLTSSQIFSHLLDSSQHVSTLLKPSQLFSSYVSML